MWNFEREELALFKPGEDVRSQPFRLQGIDLNIFFYPNGTKDGDGAHLALFLKSSRAFAAQISVDDIGPRSLSHDGKGVWGYPIFCAIALPDRLHLKIEVLCWRDTFIPRRLNVSYALCDRANLEMHPFRTGPFSRKRCFLWLGGDPGSISRTLLAWYFSVLGIQFFWCKDAPSEYWTPSADLSIVGVATGDDDLLKVQDATAVRFKVEARNDIRTTWSRQHKFAQRFAVEPERCRKDYTLCHATLDALRNAIDEIGGYPCVLKIPLSDSSAGVCIVHEEYELGAALKNTIGPAQFWGNFSPLSDLQDEMQKALAYRYESPRQVLVEKLLTQPARSMSPTASQRAEFIW